MSDVLFITFIIFLRAMGYSLIMKVRVEEKHLLQEKLQDFSQKKN